jgi:hypothetical protein
MLNLLEGREVVGASQTGIKEKWTICPAQTLSIPRGAYFCCLHGFAMKLYRYKTMSSIASLLPLIIIGKKLLLAVTEPCITTLPPNKTLQIIIRSGMTEAQVDAEVVAMLEDTESVRESDEGVNSVLLASAQVWDGYKFW